MNSVSNNKTFVRGVFTAALLCACATQTAVMAAPGDESDVTTNQNSMPFVPFSLADTNGPLLGLDNGNADKTQLQLQLSQPLTLQTMGRSVTGNGNRPAYSSGTGMSYAIDDSLSLNSGIVLQQSAGFQPLGSIHCQNGTLDAVSYSASNCYFIDDGPNGTGTTIALGASYDLGRNTKASLNLFKSEASVTATPQAGNGLATSALLDPFEFGSSPRQPLTAGMAAALGGLQRAESELTGIDLQFQVGISTDQAGDMVLGLQLTRILDSGMEGVFYSSPGARNWTIAEPYDSAKLSLGWNKGSFSGGMQTYYRAPVTFLNQNELDGQATFDVQFTWRAPWNASVSVGASNVLNSGVNEDAATDSGLVDPLESIYGRIPYVRYKQDL